MYALLSPPKPSESGQAAAAPPGLTEPISFDGHRELVLLAAADGRLLVVDRGAADGSDARLVAALAADEPRINASIVCDLYLADGRRPRCQLVVEGDFAAAPALPAAPVPPAEEAVYDNVLCDRHRNRFHLALASSGEGRLSELRWMREQPDGALGAAECVSARQVVGALEDYEPVRSLTAAAIERHRCDPAVSVATLGLELRRLGASPIVLNRRLREAVLDASMRRGISLSAIALACGRSKLDRRGRHSGETSWLARRVGLLTDGRRPNPWVHTDVLALIARNGLGIAPHEVELG